MGKNSFITRREFVKSSALGGASLLVPEMVAQPVNAPNHDAPLESGKPEAVNVTDSTILENEMVRIEVNSASGDITGLRNKRSGKEFIAAKEWARIFRLNVPFRGRVTGYLCDYWANSLDSWKQNKCEITRQKDGGSQSLTVQWPDLESEAGKFPITVRFNIRLPNNSDEAFLQLEVINGSPFRVKEVFFPWISGVGAIEGSQTDTFVTSEAIRRVADLRTEQSGNWEEYPYLLDSPVWPGGPYSLSMPWINYGSRREGLYLSSLARESILHMLMLQNFGDQRHPILGIAWAFAPYIEPGKVWRAPEMVLSLHEGDWHVAADKYRASLAGWHQKPETPPEFRKAFASFNSLFTARDFNEIADLADDIRKYGLRDLVMWNFGDYYPNVREEDDLSVDPPRLGLFTPQWGGEARLKAANEKARALGVRTGIIFSQLAWNKDTLTPELKELAEKWVLRRESGDSIMESWDHQHFGAAQWSHTQRYFGHLVYKICQGDSDWQKFAINNIIGVLTRAGYTMMFHDEGATSHDLCFSPEHHHPDVSSPCMAPYGYLKSLKAAMRAVNSNAILIGEGWNVVASQSMDLGWSWGSPPNPEIFRYTLPWVFNAIATDADPGQANKYFVLGIHLAVVAKSLENGKNLSDFPEFAKHLARLANFHDKTERFWVDGTFQDDIGLRVSGAFGKVYTMRNEIAIMIANLTSEAADASFELDCRRYDTTAGSYSMISSSGRSDNGRADMGESALKVTQSLAPYEVIAIVFGRRQKQN